MLASQATQTSKNPGTYSETALIQSIKYILYFNKCNNLMQKMFVLKTSLWNKSTAAQQKKN